MKRTFCLAAFALGSAVLGATASLLTGGCGVSPAITVVHLGSGQKAEEVKGDVVKTRRGGQEAYVGLRGGFYVVRNMDDWRNAWPGGKEQPLPSTLDPSRSMLLLAVAEDKDEAVQLQVSRVVETGDFVHVWVRETKAGENCNTKVERAPFDVVVAPRIDKPVKFYVEEERAESCGEAPAVAVKCRLNENPSWGSTVTAQPGDKVDCEMSTETRGKFAVVDSALLLGELPGGSSAKLAYTRSASRGAFAVDVFGNYLVRGEATDEAGRKAQGVATIEALPPKTRDVLVQLVWTNFDVSDDPDTFPRVKLRTIDETRDARNKIIAHECSHDVARPDLCEVKTHSAYTHMKLKASDKLLQLDVRYIDERIEKGPLVCVQLYFEGARTAETCDRVHRSADERWQVGTVDMATGKLFVPGGPPEVSDAGVATAEAGSTVADAAPPTKAPAPATPVTTPAPPAKK